MTPPLIAYHNVTVNRRGRAVLRNLTLAIPQGQHVAILGPNGCGKSTLIKTITRELYPAPDIEDSYLEIMGRRLWNVFELRAMIGIVSYDWLDKCTCAFPAREIILSGFHASVGIWPHHAVTPEMEQRAEEVIRLLEIEHLADRPTDELSSGESRRVLIARALVHRPKALMLDEPTNSLDLHSTHGLREMLAKIAAGGTSVVLVTHHLADVIPEIERVVLLKQGRVFADGPKDQVLTQDRLSGLFETEVEVIRRDGYYHAW